MMERSVGKVRKKLPIGIDGFEKIRTNDFYYVDKTLFIKAVYTFQAFWKDTKHEYAEEFF